MIMYTGIHYIQWDPHYMTFVMDTPLKQEMSSFVFFSALFQSLALLQQNCE